MKTKDITFNGQAWEQLTKSERITSIKWCVDHAFDSHTLHHKWIGRWLIIHGPSLGVFAWRKILREVRDKIAAEQIALDAPKKHDSHLAHAAEAIGYSH